MGGSNGPEIQKMARILIGLILPFIAIVLFIPIVNGVDVSFFNVPFIFIWLFCWFFLTSACLAICWYYFDRPDEEEGHYGLDS